MPFAPTLLVLAALATVPPYEFHSNRWVNLHQRLLHQAQQGTPATPARLNAEEKATWDGVVATYKTLFQKRSPVFNRELMDIDAALAASTAELPAIIPPKAAEALRRAMPLYERAQWPEDDAVNRFWITLAEPLLRAAGPELLAAVGNAYGTPMPKRIHVDVSAYGGEYGAYTVGDAEQVRVVMSSLDETYQGFSALEMLMHEPSHGVVGAVDYAIGGDLTRLAKELNVKPNRNLWHALLFYTTGVLTRDALARRGVTNYEPVIYRGMFKGGYRGLQQAIETHWGAYLGGKKTREEAIRAMLTETSTPVP
jgi:hypothetical protein